MCQLLALPASTLDGLLSLNNYQMLVFLHPWCRSCSILYVLHIPYPFSYQEGRDPGRGNFHVHNVSKKFVYFVMWWCTRETLFCVVL